MKKSQWISATLLFILTASFVTVYFSRYQRSTFYKFTCLSATVPYIVLHYEQEEIVKLLQNLVDEENVASPEKFERKEADPIFSRRADQQLLKIADIFKIRGSSASINDADVTGVAQKAIRFIEKDSPDFMNQCVAELDLAEKQCGRFENPTDSQKNCLQSHSEKIDLLVKTLSKKQNS